MMIRATPLLVLTLLLVSTAQAAILQLPDEDDIEYVDWRYLSDVKIRSGGAFNELIQSIFTHPFAVTVSSGQGEDRLYMFSTVRMDLENRFKSDHTEYQIRVWFEEPDIDFSPIVYSKKWTICDNGCDITVPAGQWLDSNLVAYFTPTHRGRYLVKEYLYTADSNRVIGTTEFIVYDHWLPERCPADYCEYTWADLFDSVDIEGGRLINQLCYEYAYNPASTLCEKTSRTDTKVECFEGYEVNDAGDGCQALPPGCENTAWEPSAEDVCAGSEFTQTSNCGNTRRIDGTKDCSPACEDSSWSPLASTICEGETFTQSSNCQNQRVSVGTKVCQQQCTDTSWLPLKSSVCEGEEFSQTSNCQNQRTVTGTKDCAPACTDSSWTPLRSSVCSGEQFSQTSNCQNERPATGTKDCTPVCEDTEWLPLREDVCTDYGTFTQNSNCGSARTATGTKDCSWTCEETSWLPAPTAVCSGYQFTQTSNCGTTRHADGEKDCSVQCTDTSWLPATNGVCDGTEYDQTSNCGSTRSATGTKDCSQDEDGDECTVSTWTPPQTDYCDTLEIVQVSNCDTTRWVDGEKDCTVGSANDNSDENTDEVEDEGDLFTRLLIIGGVGYAVYWAVFRKGAPLSMKKRRKRR